MELEIFKQAKSIKENLDNLERQKYKLESALKSCGLSVTIEFNRPGGFIRTDEVSFNNKEIIKEMITKELERVNEEIELVKIEFEKL
jgi:hypothetical protein